MEEENEEEMIILQSPKKHENNGLSNDIHSSASNSNAIFNSEEIILEYLYELDNGFQSDLKNQSTLDFILENPNFFQNPDYSLSYRAECNNILKNRLFFILDLRKEIIQRKEKKKRKIENPSQAPSKEELEALIKKILKCFEIISEKMGYSELILEEIVHKIVKHSSVSTYQSLFESGKIEQILFNWIINLKDYSIEMLYEWSAQIPKHMNFFLMSLFIFGKEDSINMDICKKLFRDLKNKENFVYDFFNNLVEYSQTLVTRPHIPTRVAFLFYKLFQLNENVFKERIEILFRKLTINSSILSSENSIVLCLQELFQQSVNRKQSDSLHKLLLDSFDLLLNFGEEKEVQFGIKLYALIAPYELHLLEVIRKKFFNEPKYNIRKEILISLQEILQFLNTNSFPKDVLSQVKDCLNTCVINSLKYDPHFQVRREAFRILFELDIPESEIQSLLLLKIRDKDSTIRILSFEKVKTLFEKLTWLEQAEIIQEIFMTENNQSDIYELGEQFLFQVLRAKMLHPQQILHDLMVINNQQYYAEFFKKHIEEILEIMNEFAEEE